MPNHHRKENPRELLNIKLFSQPFNRDAQPNLQLDECKSIAKLYAKLENTISVLSDMSSRKSYIYAGAAARQIGFEPTVTEINSIWEDDLLSRIHHEDLQKKYLLELQFFQLIKTIELEERLNYSLITKLRIKNSQGKYVSVQHRLLYLSTTAEGNVWLVLCLYNLLYDQSGFGIPQGVILNSKTGAIIDNRQDLPDKLLSAREWEIIKLINFGMKCKEIADKLSLSIHTINRHRQNIFQKLGVDNAIEAIRVANNIGLLQKE